MTEGKKMKVYQECLQHGMYQVINEEMRNMIEELKDSIGIEIIKINNSESLIDIIIRGEMQNKNQGFIIHSTNNKNINYKICMKILET